jgi:hypothetical protein
VLCTDALQARCGHGHGAFGARAAAGQRWPVLAAHCRADCVCEVCVCFAFNNWVCHVMCDESKCACTCESVLCVSACVARASHSITKPCIKR